MLLDWLLKTEEGNISYEELKMFALQNRWGCSQWRCKTATWQNTAANKHYPSIHPSIFISDRS